jgi:cell wall-associated NlpC family hydrolase
MGLDGIAGVHARIAQIQQRFTAALAPAAPAGGVAGDGSATDFASLLASSRDPAVRTTAPVPWTAASTLAPVSDRARTFLDEALRQAGDPYVWGAHTSPSDADPGAFDCSELVRWAAARAGVQVPDGSWLQYLDLKEKGALVPVEQALRTPGALLFSFSSEPERGGGRPSEAHVAISLGDGRTIEARGREYGVGVFDAGDRFEYGAVIPGL